MNVDCHGSRAVCDMYTHNPVFWRQSGTMGIPGQSALYILIEEKLGMWLSVRMSASHMDDPGLIQSNTHNPVRMSRRAERTRCVKDA